MQVAGQHGHGLPCLMATGARVSNAYPTCPPHGDRLPKGRLIRDAVRVLHGSLTKGLGRWRRGVRSISLLAGQRPTKATMDRGSERKVPHTGTETRSRLLREAAVRNIGQWPQG